MRLIDDKDIYSLFDKNGTAKLHVADIDLIRRVDAVEVVRCKDCAYYEANCCFNTQWDLESSTELPLVREIDFCSYGERKDGAGE